MEYQGICHKMRTKLGETIVGNTLSQQDSIVNEVQYSLVLNPFETPMNPLLGNSLELHWTGRIFCVDCGNKTSKSFAQGHCYKCFTTKASCDLCMMKPETCHHHLGTCREPEWAEKVCFNPHIVYLANSSGLKVGITRATQIPTRWLDQGATQGLPIFETQNRFLCGVLEVLIAQEIADKTDWRKLLKGEAVPLDLSAKRDALFTQYQDKLTSLQHAYPEQVKLLNDLPTQQFVYPVNQYPIKVSTHSFDKNPLVKGKLNGIKGQYLLLDTGVINIRKFSGYELILRF